MCLLFGSDLVGSCAAPLFAARFSSLWSLPTHSKRSFRGGWFSSPLRPSDPVEEWPRIGIGVMEKKSKNQMWDRWSARGPNPNQQQRGGGGSRSLSWRLKPPHGWTDSKPGRLEFSAGDSRSQGNSALSPSSLLNEGDSFRRMICQKCGEDGHHARDCAKSLWCEICLKETHVTAKCVWPKQIKPTMPVVGLAADGLGFYMSQYAKKLPKNPKISSLGFVTVLEGAVSVEDLENDFGYHFPWGRNWKAARCHEGFLMQFPSQERLQELVNFTELKMKFSGVKIAVTPWSSQAKAKARLHTTWVTAENVPDELKNYQAICELGSVIGAVDEVDLRALADKNLVRFKVHVKSTSMIPPVIEIGVKPFLYDIFFKVENIEEEGWNDEAVCLGKRASVDTQDVGGSLPDQNGKRAKNVVAPKNVKYSEFKNNPALSGKTQGLSVKDVQETKGDNEMKEDDVFGEGENDEKVDYGDSDEDLLDSQELDVLVKGMDTDNLNSEISVKDPMEEDRLSDEFQAVKNKKGKSKMTEYMEGTRKSSRLEAAEDIKIADKATSRAEAKDAFIHKERDGKRDGGGRKQNNPKAGQ